MTSLNNISSLSQLSNIAQRKQHGGKEVLSIPVDDLISAAQVRKRFRGLQELGDAMKRNGQENPISTSPKNKDGKYLIRKGERRWRAAKLVGLARVDVIVDTRMQERIDEIAGQLGENIHRDGLTAFEIADSLGELQKMGLSNAELAQTVSKSAAYVSVHLKLLGIPMLVRALADEGLCDDAETLYNLGKIYDLSQERCEEILAIAREEQGISREASRQLLSTLKSDLGKAPTGNKRGRKVTESKLQTDKKPAATKQQGSTGTDADHDKEPHDDDGAEVKDPANSDADKASSLDEKSLIKTAQQNSPAAQSVKPSDTTVATKPDDTHKQPSQVNVQTNPALNYLPVEAAKMSIAVQLRIDDIESHVTDGFLMTDRVSLRKGFVWMRTKGGNVTEVRIEQITLMGVNSTD